MKKHTRFLAWIMTLVMIFSCFGGTTVFAVDTDTTADSCNDHTDWQELTTATIGDFMTLSAGHYYLNEGSYYLKDDLAMGVTIYIWPGDTVNLCLNGHDISMTNSNRTILNPKNSATLNLYDCGTQVRYYDENGWVTTADGAWETATEEEKEAALTAATNPIKIVGGAIYGASSYDKGGAGVFIQNYATFNMYGGNILGCSTSSTLHCGGGVYNYEGTFNMYRGVIAYNSSSTFAGGLFVRSGSTVNMYGGEIAYNYAPTSGAGVYSGGTFNMYNDASIHDNYGSYLASGFYAFGGGTLNMYDTSSISNNISGDGGSAGVYMPSYNSVLNMYDTSSITGNKSTGIAAGVGLISGVMTISDDAKVFDNYVVESVEIEEIDTTNANDVKLKMLGDVGEKVVDSNVYLYNGKTITFDNFDGTDVYVTAAAGLGRVATSVDDTEDSGNLSSDVAAYYAVRETNNTEVHLMLAQTLDGKSDEVEYYGDIDLSELGIFDVITDDTVYTITGGTGVGEIDGTTLDSSSAGTFIIEAYTPACNTNPPTWQTSTLTVTAKEVTIDDIDTIGSVVGTTVELDNTSGTIDGDVNNDDVSIDFTVAYGEITDTTYTGGDTGKFDVTIHGISLTGDDAGNYTLGTVNDGEGTTVTINATIPHVSWPTAVDLVYGDTRRDADLMGGTAVVQTGNTTDGYKYTTVTGKFVWVSDEDNAAVNAAGTHTYEVQFVIDDTYDAEIIAAIKDLTHNVTQVVQPAEVTFTIADSTLVEGTKLSITVTDENGDVLDSDDSDDYDYLYYVDGEWVDTEPTAVGSYLIGASLTSNYRHAGTQESTAKQIGAFEIYAEDGSASTTYDVTFTGFTDTTSYNITGALPQTIHILPTLEGAYTGWEHSDGTIYDFGSRFPQPEDDVAFTAVEANDKATLSGTVTGIDFGGTENTALEGVVVTLMQGAEQIAVTTTDEKGEYSFEVPEGRYNVVVTRDQVIRNEITLYVELDSDDDDEMPLAPIVIPDIRQNTIFNVASGMTAITIDGMDDLIGTDTVSYKVELNPSSDTAAILAAAAENGLTANNAKLYIDVSIQKRGESATNYSEIDLTDDEDLTDNEDLTFYIPLAGIYQGYKNYSVYFDDGSDVVELDDSFFTVDGDLLTLTVQKSGVYGLAFWNTPTTLVDIENITVDYTNAGIDLNTIELFDDTGISDIEDITYVITSGDGDGDGVGTIEDNYLYVDKIGKFDILISFVVGGTSYVGTATFTVTAKTVTISGITCVDQEVDSTSNKVALNTGALLTGVETGDSVQIDFTNANGAITAGDYATSDTLTTKGEEIFTVSASGFALTGDDAGNYKLADDLTVTSQVTVTMSLVYIAWPAAHDIIYGQTKSETDLYGGKVVVYSNGTYTDITENGEFQWVVFDTDDKDNDTDNGLSETDTTILADAGTYTYDVQFVANEGTSGSYSDALKAATQMVTQVVQPVAVTFTVEDNVIADIERLSTLSVTATYNDNDTETELDETYYELWYYDVDAESWSDTAPTTVNNSGEYLLGASLTSNYRHAGSQESTAKQIGAFTIGTESATYGVTFTGYTGDAGYNVTDALPQTIHILPTLDENYTGWTHQDGTTYDFGERFPQPEYDVTFTAIAAPEKSATISGTITGTDLNGDENTKISRVGVALYQGSTLIGYTTTSADAETLGEYSFDVVPGMYNLVITYDLDTTTEITYYIDCTNDDVKQDVTLPDVIQNIVMEVTTGLPDMVVNGLTVLLDTTQDSEVLLEITASDDTATKQIIVDEAANAGIDEDEIKEFFNIDLSSRTGEEPSFTAVTHTGGNLLTFYIPLTGMYQGHNEYTVYRYHDGQVQTIKEEPNDDGEFIEVSGANLIIHANKFSLYGIAFNNAVSTSSSSNVGTIIDPDQDAETEPTVESVESQLPFTDVSVDDWFYEDILYLYELGLMSGTTATTFDPYGGNSRAMVAQMMYNLEGQPEGEESDFFPDVVAGQWFTPAINWCASYGVVDGYPDGLYRPNQIISRQEFTNVLYDHVLHLGYNVSDLADLSDFADAPSDWAKTYVMWAVEAGLIQGDNNGYLDCSDQLTRCEAAAIFARFLRNVYES